MRSAPGLQLGAAARHHALQAREAALQPRQRRRCDLRARARTRTSCSSSRERRGGPSCAPPGSSSWPRTSTTSSAAGRGSTLQPIAGRERAGSSTRQSIARGTPTVETDYLNGEIALLGRLHGVATPVNDALCELSARHVRERRRAPDGARRRGAGAGPVGETMRMDQFVADGAAEIAARAQRELEALVAVSSPSGDVEGAEEAIALCAAFLPPQAEIERVPCSTPGSADDLVARIAGQGSRRLLLLGHLDTVIEHSSHAPLRRDGDRLYGPGTVDMKGGVVLSLGVGAGAGRRVPRRSPSSTVLLVTDEEWRRHEFVHVKTFSLATTPACASKAGQLTSDGDEAVVVHRKAAGTMRVGATGRASHSGSAPDQGRNALLALAATAIDVAAPPRPGRRRAAQRGSDRGAVRRRVQRRARRRRAAVRHARRPAARRSTRCARRCPPSSTASASRRRCCGSGPGWTRARRRAALLERAGARLGRPIIGCPPRRRQRREPLRAAHPADRRRPRPAWRRRPHPRGVRPRAVAAPARGGGAGGGGRSARFLAGPSSPVLATCDPCAREHDGPNATTRQRRPASARVRRSSRASRCWRASSC